MFQNFKKILVFAQIMLVFFFHVQVCSAQMFDSGTLDKMGNQQGAFMDSSGYQDADISQIIAVVIQTFLGFLGIIFVVLIIYGGYLWMTARGNEEQVNKAKDTIKRAAVGLVIILAAYSITYFVFNSLPFEGGTGGDGGLEGEEL